MNAILPKISNEKKIYFKNALHPVLWRKNNEQKIETVPQTIKLNQKQQVIVISGPNAGGKSITLKTIGLLQIMIQSGILIPVDEKSETYIFDTVLTDIGDNQSIENQLSTTESISQNFESRNFNIEGVSIDPKLSYLLSRQTRFDIFYNYNFQDNLIGGKEQLDQQKFGLGFSYANQQQFAISGEFNYIQNDFSGSAFSPVAYQMLEGLQPDKNYTWQFLTQKKLTKYLDLNLSYNGRKSENLDAIHTGSVQLRAYF
jgi:hypothetical protein